jgi:hypothetical protein
MGLVGLLIGVAVFLAMLATGDSLLLALVLAVVSAMVAATAVGVGLLVAAVVEEVVAAHRKETPTKGTATMRGTMTRITQAKDKAKEGSNK